MQGEEKKWGGRDVENSGGPYDYIKVHPAYYIEQEALEESGWTAVGGLPTSLFG